jgi:L-threonylcarbamoyladenylate synthase
MATFVEIQSLTDSDWEEAASGALRDGGILVHPTTSVYGLGGAGRRADASIARLKGRAVSIPILRLVLDVDQLRTLHPTVEWREDAQLLAADFWPGPLTLILEDGSERGLAVRAESHPVTRRILTRLGDEIGSTSLNLTGEPAARTMHEARRVLRAMPESDRPLHFLSAGDLPGPPPSTLLSLRAGGPRILREGAIGRDQIESSLGTRVLTENAP